MIPGEYQLAEGDILANIGRKTVKIEVTNSGTAQFKSVPITISLKLITPLNLIALWREGCV